MTGSPFSQTPVSMLLKTHTKLLVSFLPYQYLRYNAITSPASIVSELDRRSLFTLLVFVWFVWLFCFLVAFCWYCLAFCWFSAMDRDGYWTMYRSHARSLLCHPFLMAALYALITNLSFLCNVQLNWRKPRGVERKKNTKLLVSSTDQISSSILFPSSVHI